MRLSDVSTSEAGHRDVVISEWLFLFTFFVYAYFYAGAGWNQNAQLDLTRAIVERHTFAIDAYALNTGDRSFANGHAYSNKAPALSWIAAIPYAIIRAAGVTNLAAACYLCTILTVGIAGALVPALIYREGRRRGIDARWSAFIALAIALATQLFPYATIFMVHVPSGALLLFAFVARRAGWGGFAAGVATAMNYLCGPAILVFAFVRKDRDRIRFVAGSLPPLIALAIYNKICFGSFLTTSISRLDPRFVTKGAALGVLNPPSLEAFYGITISPYRGLFFFAPLLLLALVPLVRERAILVVSLIFFAVNTCFNGWEAGFGIGARYLVPLIPLWGLALLRAKPRALVVALAAISFAINFTAAAVDPQPSATIPRPLTQYLIPLLIDGRFSSDVPITAPWSAETFTGHTSVNRLAHDEAIVFTRHPPGSVDSEWSSFNLGEPFFGAGDARSLIPIAVLIAAGVAAILAKTRRATRESAATAPSSP